MASQRDGASGGAAPARSSEWAAFSASLPLFVVTVGLFIASGVVYSIARTAGPGGFPLWGLLMTLGFIAAIGTTVSWFFAKGAAEDAAASTEPVAEEPETGRPIPDVRRVAVKPAAEVWDESTIPVRPTPPPASRPVATAPVAPDDVERALDEIARIEEELEGREPSPIGRSPAPARS
jgi:hypothetical protein